MSARKKTRTSRPTATRPDGRRRKRASERRGVTIRDVALRAGVSIATVSRVLNRTAPVDERKRVLVETAAADLGYIPNPAAQSLLGRRTGGIGVLLPYVSGEFYSELLNGLDSTAKELGYFLLISTSHDRLEEWQAGARAMFGRVDGLVVMSPILTPDRLEIRSDEPTVYVNTPGAPDGANGFFSIGFSNLEGTFEATRYLLEAGHRTIAHVRGPVAHADADLREEGFRRAMAGHPAEECPVVEGGYHQEEGFAAARVIAAMQPRPTAVVAANDYCAMGVISGLLDAGLHVPGDVSVIGFDGVPSGRYSHPTLSTVEVPVRRLGERAVRTLVDVIQGHRAPPTGVEMIPVSLVLRASSRSLVEP